MVYVYLLNLFIAIFDGYYNDECKPLVPPNKEEELSHVIKNIIITEHKQRKKLRRLRLKQSERLKISNNKIVKKKGMCFRQKRKLKHLKQKVIEAFLEFIIKKILHQKH